jgi:hypothetical protein
VTFGKSVDQIFGCNNNNNNKKQHAKIKATASFTDLDQSSEKIFFESLLTTLEGSFII